MLFDNRTICCYVRGWRDAVLTLPASLRTPVAPVPPRRNLDVTDPIVRHQHLRRRATDSLPHHVAASRSTRTRSVPTAAERHTSSAPSRGVVAGLLLGGTTWTAICALVWLIVT